MRSHRDRVGGLWEEVGKLQFDFLVSHGLKRSDYLLDLGCGSLRAGVHLIPHMEPGHYYGVDMDASLIAAGVGLELTERRGATFRVSRDYELDFGLRFDVIWCHSLLTHLPPEEVVRCLSAAGEVLGGVMWATWFEGFHYLGPRVEGRHTYRRRVTYPWRQFKAMAAECGLTAERVGQWAHPRGQMMARLY